MNARITFQARAQARVSRQLRGDRGSAVGEVERAVGAVGGGAAALLAEQLGEPGGLKLGRLPRQVELARLRVGPEPLPQRRRLAAGSEQPLATLLARVAKSAPGAAVNGSVDPQHVNEVLATLLAVELNRGGLLLAGAPAGGIDDRYRRWMAGSLRILEKHGQRDASDGDAAWARWQALEDSVPEERAALQLVATALRALPRILRGEIAATAVLFPDSSLESVAAIYSGNARADYFNSVLAESVGALLESDARERPGSGFRLLEMENDAWFYA